MLIKTKSSLYLLVAFFINLSCSSSISNIQIKTSHAPRFDRAPLDAFINEQFDDGHALGLSLLVYHNNREIYYGESGMADRDQNMPWHRNTLAQIYSMTKPITGVVLLSLYEDGLYELEETISKYLPEFRQMYVHRAARIASNSTKVKAQNEIKIIDLMRHTSGLSYDWQDNETAKEMLPLNVFDPQKPLKKMSEELASLPLVFEPGTRWHYSASVDILARLAEVLTQKPWDEVVKERLLSPLEMHETKYNLHTGDTDRLGAVYEQTASGKFKKEFNTELVNSTQDPIKQTNGGHGLVSTIDDYMRFAEMLQNQGQLDGVEILKPETFALMSTSQLPEQLKEYGWLKKGELEFGLTVSVRLTMPNNHNDDFGFPGEISWSGRASTLFWVDPANKISAVFFVQKIPFDNQMHTELRKVLYQSFEGLYPF